MKNIPQDARIVFQGARDRFKIYQWQQQIFDGSVLPYETIVYSDGAKVFLVKEGKILVNKEEQKSVGEFLALPGGQCDAGETPLQTAERELREETGYEAKEITLWKSITNTLYAHQTLHYFIAKGPVLSDKVRLDGGEKIENIWLNFDELLLLSENPLFRNKQLALELYYFRCHPEAREKFKRMLFT